MSAACFAKLDATHGYFQIPLDEEASKLTTFILLLGRYRYLRAPMGFFLEEAPSFEAREAHRY